MLPDLTTLALFLKAVDSGSLSKAARDSCIALSAASRRISLMEDRLGVSLLHRLGAGVHPTAAGLVMAESVRKILSDVDQLVVQVSEFDRQGKGVVRLGANPAVMAHTLPPRLAQFRSLFPQIKLEMKELSSAEIVRELRENMLDLGIVTASVHAQGLQSHRYAFDRLCIVLPAEHHMKARRMQFSALLDYPFVCLERSQTLREHMMQSAATHGRRLDIAVTVRSIEAFCRLVSSGFGIGILSADAVQNFLRPMRLRTVALAEPWAAREMTICTPMTRRPMPVQLLLRHLLSEQQDAR